MVYLRLQLLGVQAQEPWRYYVAFQILEAGGTAATAQGVHGTPALPPDLVCRTDTARPSRTPEFSSRTFLLRLPPAAAEICCSIPRLGHLFADTDDSSPEPAAKLAISLFAAPSVAAPAGPIVAGREVDRLVASAVLGLEQQLLQRLAAGEHVAVPVLLQETPNSRLQQMPDGLGSQAAQLQSVRNSQQASYNTSKPHVLLELMLLQAEPIGLAGASMQSSYKPAAAAAVDNSMLLGSSYDSGQEESAPADAGVAGVAAAGESSEGDVELLVLVSAASNVPLVPGPQGHLQPSSALVALRAGMDIQGPAQASTTAAPSINPFWGELLSIRCQESQLSHSRLHISLLSQSTNRALAKGSIKLSGVLPGQHYSLALALTDSCTLYLTVVLGLGCQTLLAALQGSGLTAAAAETGGKLQLLQMGLPQLDRPLQGWLSPVAVQQAGAYEVLAVWKCASAGQQQQQQEPVCIQLDAREGADASSGAMLRVYNSNNGLLAVRGPSRAGSAASSRDATAAAGAAEGSDGSNLKGLSGVLAVVPVCSSEQDVPWPVSHLVTLPVLITEQTTATLELHLQPYPSSSSSSERKSSASRLPASTCFARLTLPLAAIAKQSAGRPCQLSQLQLSCNPQLTTPDAANARVTLQATRWDVPRYQQQLQQLAQQQQRQQQQQQQRRQQHMPALLSSASPVPEPSRSPQVKGSRQAAGATAAAAAAATSWAAASPGQHAGGAAELLLGDLLTKQQALERLQRQLDIAGQCAEAADGRIAELQAANSNLTSDLQHLRQLLHEEKEAAATANSLLDSSQPHLLPGTHIPLETATREQVLQQLTIVLGKHATERARNGELVRRLQQLHAEKVDVIELQRQYLELQEAHFQQSKLLVDQEIHQNTLATLKKAVTDQEAVITRLQQLLSASATRNKELEVWKASANTLQQEVNRLREELANVSAAGVAAEQQAATQAAAAALAESEAAAARASASFDAQLMGKESERLSAAMRAEKAETSAVAAQNELLEVTKRYAREIAQLKTKLAEKDAQLLGGFGSIDHLTGSALDSPTAAGAAGMGHWNPGALAGLPTLQDLGLPSTAAMQHQPAAALPSHLAGPAGANALWYGGGSGRPPGGGGSPLSASAAAAAGPAGSPRLPDALQSSSMRSQRPNSHPMAAAAAAGAAAGGVDGAAGSASGRGFAAQGSYTLRAGSAEARLMHQSAADAQRQGSGRVNSKPGSPLLPTAQQQRLTTSADGVRSPGGGSAAVPGNFGRGSPSQQQQQQQQQQGRVSRDMPSPQQAWGASSPQQRPPQLQERRERQEQQQRWEQQQQQQHWEQQQQQQHWEQQGQPLGGVTDEDEYEDVDEDGDGGLDDDGLEEAAGQPTASPAGRQGGPAGGRAPDSPQQQQQRRQQQPQQAAQSPAASPKKRGALAGFFGRG